MINLQLWSTLNPEALYTVSKYPGAYTRDFPSNSTPVIDDLGLQSKKLAGLLSIGLGFGILDLYFLNNYNRNQIKCL